MCGILGCFSTGGYIPDNVTFRRSLMTMRHRGPDDIGTFFKEGISLGHVRLVVIDPSGGHQPWVDSETGVAITYNGEFYNYIEEREILEQKWHKFISNSDTEVMVRMYLEYGFEMLKQMNGL